MCDIIARHAINAHRKYFFTYARAIGNRYATGKTPGKAGHADRPAPPAITTGGNLFSYIVMNATPSIHTVHERSISSVWIACCGGYGCVVTG